MTQLGLQNVPDGFKQCHLKARYVTEKQNRGKRDLSKEGEGGRGDAENETL